MGTQASTDSRQPGEAGRESSSLHMNFDNTYARLPSHFFAEAVPARVASPQLVELNVALCHDLRLDPEALASPEGVSLLAGNTLPPDAQPLALAYAGHQFGHFVPQLGDGRAILLGEVVGNDGHRYDLQLKGSGRTAFSRGGDGRAAVGPVLREYIVSEAMAALGIPTTRALAAVLTGETVYRETPLPGAVFTRVASSHLRVGTFQYFAARGDTEGVRTLADYAIARHYPDLRDRVQPYTAFLQAVLTRHARLVARWLSVGFVHGVMNTDNTSISGETLDYGPCAFLENYDPGTVFSSIDRQGRYAFANQPNIAVWNMTRLAEALLPLLAEEHGGPEAAVTAAQNALATFEPEFQAAYLAVLRSKFGLQQAHAGDDALAAEFLKLLYQADADYTLAFRHLADAAEAEADSPLRLMLQTSIGLDAWLDRWRARLAEEASTPDARALLMQSSNPLYIPRNHLVEAAIQAALQQQDFDPFRKLLKVVTQPFQRHPGWESYAQPARPEERILATFCGT